MKLITSQLMMVKIEIQRKKVMTDSQEKKSNDSRDSRTINIEIPANCLEVMFNMMTWIGGFGAAQSECCGGVRADRRSPSGDNEEQEIRIVVKRKEQ